MDHHQQSLAFGLAQVADGMRQVGRIARRAAILDLFLRRPDFQFQVAVDDVVPILAGLNAAGWPFFLKLEEVWYRAGTSETGVRQFLVQDPDGYLVRFSQSLGQRPVVKLGLP